LILVSSSVSFENIKLNEQELIILLLHFSVWKWSKSNLLQSFLRVSICIVIV